MAGRHAAPAPDRRPRNEVRRPSAAPVRRSTFADVESTPSHRVHVRRAAYAALAAPASSAAASTITPAEAPASLSRRAARAAQSGLGAGRSGLGVGRTGLGARRGGFAAGRARATRVTGIAHVTETGARIGETGLAASVSSEGAAAVGGVVGGGPSSRALRRARRTHASDTVVAAVAPKATRSANQMRHIKRLAHVLAPVLALTSGLAVALPANAAENPSADVASAAIAGQDYTVAAGWTIPVSTSGTSASAGLAPEATVITTPTLVVNFGVSVTQAKAAVVADLTAGGQRAKIVSTALTYLGDPYVEGGASHSGIDCSGLVMMAYQSVGIDLVHYVPSQDAAATTIPESEAQPGDLVVYDNEEHIGLYLGDGLVLQAPHPGEPVDIIPMFSAAHHFARVLPAGS